MATKRIARTPIDYWPEHRVPVVPVVHVDPAAIRGDRTVFIAGRRTGRNTMRVAEFMMNYGSPSASRRDNMFLPNLDFSAMEARIAASMAIDTESMQRATSALSEMEDRMRATVMLMSSFSRSMSDAFLLGDGGGNTITMDSIPAVLMTARGLNPGEIKILERGPWAVHDEIHAPPEVSKRKQNYYTERAKTPKVGASALMGNLARSLGPPKHRSNALWDLTEYET